MNFPVSQAEMNISSDIFLEQTYGTTDHFNPTYSDDSYYEGQILYYVSMQGDDGTGDGSYTRPWRTIQFAIDAVEPHSTIFLLQGNYTENILINKPVNLVGESKELSTITASGFDHTISINASQVTLQNITITTGAMFNEKAGIYLNNNAHHCVISDTEIRDNYYGILLDSSHNNTFISNNVDSNMWQSIHLVSSHRTAL